MKIVCFDRLESTNKYCELLDLPRVEEFTVIWALEQTAGVGQRGNSWSSEADSNLTFSVVLHPSFLSASRQFWLTQAMALAVVDCLVLRLPEHSVSIKWPNDIYVENSKICGILTENRLADGQVATSICGIGLNVNQTLFPSELPNPTSLALLTGSGYPLRPLLEELIKCVEVRYRQLQSGDENGIDYDYLDRLFRKGMESNYLYQGEPITAVIEGVNDFGHLLLRHEDDLLACDIKEVKFLNL